MKEDIKIILYHDDNEITRVSVRLADEDLWLTQDQLAEIYCTTQENISMHIPIFIWIMSWTKIELIRNSY